MDEEYYVSDRWDDLWQAYYNKQITYWEAYQQVKEDEELDDYLWSVADDLTVGGHPQAHRFVHQLLGLPYKHYDYPDRRK